DDVAAEAGGFGDTLLGDLDRIGGLGEDRDVDLSGEGAELVDRGGPLEVGADEQRVAALLLEPAGELRGGGGLAGALQAGHEDDGGRLRREGDLHRLAAEGLDELLVDDLHHLLGRGEALGELLAGAALADATDEAAGDGDVD